MKTPLSVVISGTSSGLGLEIAKTHLQLGHTVLGFDLNAAHKEIANHANYTHIAGDFSQLWQHYETTLIHCDQLYLNASIGHYGNLQQQQAQSVKNIINFNLITQIQILKRLIDRSKKSQTAILIGSASAFVPGQNHEVYAASKAALNGFVRSVKNEGLLNLNIKIYNPGAMATNFHQQVGYDTQGKKFIAPSRIAKDIVKFASSSKTTSAPMIVNFLIFISRRFIRGFIFLLKRRLT